MRLPIPFDNPHTYAGHSGVDFPQPRGTIFRASGPGRVGLHRTTPAGGCMIWVDYASGVGVGYAHMDSYRDCPPVGADVEEGTMLGHVGNSGHSTGAHLHVEVARYATTAGFWLFFDPHRVVGQGSTASGPTPAPTPAPPTVPEEDDLMRYMYCKDSGGDLWTLLNVTSGETIQTRDQTVANGWATVWGTARIVSVQEHNNAIDAVKKTAVRPV